MVKASCLFLRNWEHYYVDCASVTTSFNIQKHIRLAISSSYPESKEPQENMAHQFEQYIIESLLYVKTPKSTNALANCEMEQFYTSNNAHQQYECLNKIFEKDVQLRTQLLQKFYALDSPELKKNILQTHASRVLHKQTYLYLAEQIHQSEKQTVYFFFGKIISLMCNHFNLQTLYQNLNG